ncbi:MAG: DUF6807 family protein [Planctomycetota bacterium]|jgi:hypothetical protein
MPMICRSTATESSPLTTSPVSGPSIVIVLLMIRGALGAGSDDSVVVPASPTTLEMAVPLDAKPVAAGEFQLAEVDGAGVTIPVQQVPALTPDGTVDPTRRRLAALIPPREGAEQRRRFTLRPKRSADENVAFRLEEIDDKSLKLWEDDSPVLVYNFGTMTRADVPENDPRRNRACYVHPVWGLNGETLTDDFPRDHYHHHGVFWTWPHVKIEDQEYDLWADRGIKQRFVDWLCRETGPIAGVIGVENGWFAGDRKVMTERVWIRAYRQSGGSRSIDLELVWIPVGQAVTLWGAGGKSYGGLTMRFAPPSRKDPNTVITVPSGPTTADLPDTPLAWADFTSKFGDCPTRSGAAVFISPSHPDYPPTWLTRHYGPLCVGWPGIKPQTFEPGKPVRLDYRVWIHKTPVDTAEVQKAYDAYKASFTAAWR